ncbi:hypothetical protein EG328_003465 [Venturia inaequalis]|uniref:Uncharacterized protein n=1 Tax=Venturia inaequalis TaxID=5025 RepID=A0A8H3URS4_VENIN|nr:hypothetical protein EG328_003465 [Venturia inaequalis]
MSNISNVFTPLLGSIKRKHTDTPATLASLSKTTPGEIEHTERHGKLGEYLGDAILGFADGLTVPFALTAGLSAYVNDFLYLYLSLSLSLANHESRLTFGLFRVGSIRVVIVGGLAELFAGAISMGLGAWLAAESDRKSYYVEEARERQEVEDCPDKEEEEIYEIFDQYHISRDAARGVVDALKVNKDCWVQFMMDFELKLPRPCSNAGWISAIVIAISYFLGGLLPMIPYFLYSEITDALYTSVAITFFVLLGFGYAKAVAIGQTRRDACFSAVQMLFVGTLAAGASYAIVRGVNAEMGGGGA